MIYLRNPRRRKVGSRKNPYTGQGRPRVTTEPYPWYANVEGWAPVLMVLALAALTLLVGLMEGGYLG